MDGFIEVFKERAEEGLVITTLDMLELCIDGKVNTESIQEKFGIPETSVLMVLMLKGLIETQVETTRCDLINAKLGVEVRGALASVELQKFLKTIKSTANETIRIVPYQDLFEKLITNEETLVYKVFDRLSDEERIAEKGLNDIENRDEYADYGGIFDASSAEEVKVIGRTAELNALKVLADKTYNRNIIISGRPGIGKRALMEKFMREYNGVIGIIDFDMETREMLNPVDTSRKIKSLVESGCTLVYIKNIEKVFRPGSNEIRAEIAADFLKMAENAGGAVVCVFNDEGFVPKGYNTIKLKALDTEFVIKIMEDKLKELIRDRKVKIDKEEFKEFIRNTFNGNIVTLTDRIDTLISLAVNTNKGKLDAELIEEFNITTGQEIKSEEPVEDMKILKTLREQISERIIGQGEAVEKVVKAIRRNKAGVRLGNKPIGTFLFVGPTGVGKTELVKVLDKEINRGKSSIIRFDMSEFSEGHSVSKLIGSPPGYVGHDDGGQLTKRIKENPNSIVLFDEIEKAHDNVYNTLLQLLDDGRLTDSKGETVDFRKAIIVMTSNAGYGAENTGKKSIGFSTKEDNENSMDNEIVLKALETTFKPEFLNRIDSVVKFNRLAYEEILKISKLLVDDVIDNLVTKGYKISVSEEVYNYVARNGFSDKYGARNIKRAIQDSIEDYLADEIIEERMTVHKVYNLGVVDGKVCFVNEQRIESYN